MCEIRGNPKEGLFGATLGFFIGFAAVSLFGPTANRFREVMDLDPALLGLLVAIPMLTGSLLRIPFSAWVDTTGGRKPFLVLLSLSIVGMTGLFLVFQFAYPDHLTAAYYPLLLLLGALSGCGIATFSVGISQVAYWFPQKRQGTALGTYAGLGNTAPGLIAFLLPLVLAAWGLVGAYLAWLVVLIAGTVVYAFTGRNAWYFQYRDQGVERERAQKMARMHGQEIFPKGTAMQGLITSAKIWKTWVLVALYFTTFGGFLALTSWLPTYWSTYYSATEQMAGTLTAVFSLLASLIRVAGGSWSDKLGGERTAMLALGTLLIGACIMTFSHTYTLSLAATILIGMGMGVGNAAVFKMVPHYVPEAVGGAAGWVGGLGAFGGFVVPPILGAFVEIEGAVGYAHGFSVYIILALVCMALAWLLRATYQPPHAAPVERPA